MKSNYIFPFILKDANIEYEMPPEIRSKRVTDDTTKEQKTEVGNGQQPSSQSCGKLNELESEIAATGEKRKTHPSAPQKGTPTKAIKLDSSISREVKLVKFLLSERARELCENPKTDPPNTDGEIKKDYFTPSLTAFEHLICAIILSRPISHVLGQRTIKTVLNDPWNFSDPKNILEAGKENEEGKTLRVEAMEQAKTQHRQKTASEPGDLAQTLVDENYALHNISSSAR